MNENETRNYQFKLLFELSKNLELIAADVDLDVNAYFYDDISLDELIEHLNETIKPRLMDLVTKIDGLADSKGS